MTVRILSRSSGWISERNRSNVMGASGGSPKISLLRSDHLRMLAGKSRSKRPSPLAWTARRSRSSPSASAASTRRHSVMSMKAPMAPRGRSSSSNSGAALPWITLVRPSAKAISRVSPMTGRPSRAATCIGRSSGATSRPSRRKVRCSGRSPAGAVIEVFEPGAASSSRSSAGLARSRAQALSSPMAMPIGTVSKRVSSSSTRARRSRLSRTTSCWARHRESMSVAVPNRRITWPDSSHTGTERTMCQR